MADLNILVPSRGRPDAAGELVDAFRETCTARTVLTFVIDEDDPMKGDYSPLVAHDFAGPTYPQVNTCRVDNTARTMVYVLNRAAVAIAVNFGQPPFAIGFMGDDHRPRTLGWDAEYLDALRELGTGIVYAEDGYQGEKLPTQCAMTADIIRALGFMAPPALRHMYVDNFWFDLGANLDRLTYLPDVLVEHMHPVAGKAEWSEGHLRVNAREVIDADAEAYAEYLRESFEADVTKVQAILDA